MGREPVYEAATLDEVLDNLKHVFPLIVFDLPQVIGFPDVEALAPKIDALLLLHSDASGPSKAVLARIAERLGRSGGNLVGLVRNAVGRAELRPVRLAA